MSNVYVPPSGAVWPPAGRPIAAYRTRADTRHAAADLRRQDIEGLAILSTRGWHCPGDWVAALIAVATVALAALVVALGLAADEPPLVTALVAAALAAALVVLGLGAALTTGAYFRRRTRRFLDSFDPAVTGRHVLLCAPSAAQRARSLLAEDAARPPRA